MFSTTPNKQTVLPSMCCKGMLNKPVGKGSHPRKCMIQHQALHDRGRKKKRNVTCIKKREKKNTRAKGDKNEAIAKGRKKNSLLQCKYATAPPPSDQMHALGTALPCPALLACSALGTLQQQQQTMAGMACHCHGRLTRCRCDACEWAGPPWPPI